MEIVKFKKGKSNVYTVYFDNTLSLKLYDDVIVKYNLLVNKNMDDKLLEEITNYNDYLDGYYKAIKYIMRKLRSEKEVYLYLQKLNINESNIKSLIDKLKHDGYINQSNYIKAYINDQINLTLNGPYKIKNELIKLGFNSDEIGSYLNEFNDLWSSRIDKIIDKKIKLNKQAGSNKLKLKITNEIINMGYEKYDIINLLNEKKFNDSELILKEYRKAYKKFSIKYKDNLNYKIKDYLYKKGYDISLIEGVINNEKER